MDNNDNHKNFSIVLLLLYNVITLFLCDLYFIIEFLLP